LFEELPAEQLGRGARKAQLLIAPARLGGCFSFLAGSVHTGADEARVNGVPPKDAADHHTGGVFMRETLAKLCFDSLLEFSFASGEYALPLRQWSAEHRTTHL
jgi:hypothetical protein